MRCRDRLAARQEGGCPVCRGESREGSQLRAKTRDSSGAAILCPHVAHEGLPILYAERSEPVDAADSGWQFLCDSGRPEDPSKAQIWSLAEVVAKDASLQTILGAPAGTRMHRRDHGAPWQGDGHSVH